jgi:nitrite reductase/ring-hydroxylating ferredoxin subunit
VPDQSNKQNELTFLAETRDVQSDRGTLVELPGRAPIAVFRLGDEFFATDDTCTHGAASLCDGEVFGGQVECPFHGGTFDVRTGAATTFPCTKPLAVYPVVVKNGQVYAHLDSEDKS